MSFTNRKELSKDLQLDGHYGSFGSSEPYNNYMLKSLSIDPVRDDIDAQQFLDDEKDDYVDAMCTLRGSLATGYDVLFYLNKTIAGLQPKSFAWTQFLWSRWFDSWPFGINEQELEKLLEVVKFDIDYFRTNANTRKELCYKLTKVARFMSTVYSFTAENCQQLSMFKPAAWYRQLEKDLAAYLTFLPISPAVQKRSELTEAERKRRVWPFEQNEKQIKDFIERMGELTAFLAKNGYLIEPMLLTNYLASYPSTRQVLIADLTIYQRQLAAFFSVMAPLEDEKKSEKRAAADSFFKDVADGDKPAERKISRQDGEKPRCKLLLA